MTRKTGEFSGEVFGTYVRYWHRPAADIGIAYGYLRAIVGRTRPLPYPGYRTVPEVPLAPRALPVPEVAVEARPDGKVVLVSSVPRTRPPRGTRERKGNGGSVAGRFLYGVYKAADELGELREVMQAIYDAHPDAPRTSDPRAVFDFLFTQGHIGDLSLGEIAQAVVQNEIEDRLIGRLNALGDVRRLGLSHDALGFATS